MGAEQENGFRRLAIEIEKTLKSGISVNRETLHFITSTFSIESMPELEAFLSDPDDSEIQSLLELLFSPDVRTQANLEEAIEKHACTGKDVPAITALLFRKKIKVPIRFPDDLTAITISPPEHFLETYIQSLRITRTLHPDLRAAVHKYVDRDLQSAIKVQLRNTRVDLTPPIRSFLGRLLKKADCNAKSFLPDLELCLALISEQPETPSLFDLFMGKKRRLLSALQQAEGFEKQLLKDNIETLILKGVRAPHIDKAEASRQITRIDTICLTVFGVTDPLLQVHTDVDLGNFSNRDDLKKAFEILS